MMESQSREKISSKPELRRAIVSRSFFTGLCATVVCVIIGASQSWLPVFAGSEPLLFGYGYHQEALLSALSSGVMQMALPILCAIPYTAAFVDDYRNGFIRLYLPRFGRMRYIRAKLISTVLSGGLVLLLGIAVTYVVFLLFFTPMETALLPGQESVSMLGPICMQALVYFVCGGLWALAGALFACLTLNKYMAYASPFICYYVLVILSERYIKKIYVINPQEWIAPQHFWPGGQWGIVLLALEIMTLIALCYAWSLRRRLSHG